MIANIWEKVELYCCKHDTPQRMGLASVNSRIIGRCPCGDPNKVREEDLCKTQLTLKETEKVLEHIEKVIIDAEFEDTALCLKDYEFKIGKRSYKVFEDDEKIKIEVL